MDTQADTYRAVKPYTNSHRVQVRRTPSFRTFQALYGGSDLQRYPGAAIAGSLKSDQAPVLVKIRTIPCWEDPLPHHLQEAFGIDPASLSTDPNFDEQPVKVARHEKIFTPTSRNGKTSTSKLAVFSRNLKCLAVPFKRRGRTCSEVSGARLC